ncbi:substrate-binding domain-containing protein [Labedaea rhizosphaerae]|uniref:Extracellular solute-binding protein n=1 Tax=Labedaea rhizosphaerae TaxID=598644 RepID=A0A4R6S070_LABRH|nr:substrate-binding domain-containing protein [Labedaea rhizosphaerae]TDP91966.1 extracellular solute-binding protein [Labedaea rhizosphaerae]
MGRHRSLEEATRRRGIASWPFAVLAVVVLVLLGWLGWSWASSIMDRRAAAAAHDCPQGQAVLKVAVAPSVEKPLKEAAKRWNDARTVVYEHCVRVTIVAIDSNEVLTGLTGKWNEGKVGTRPQAWLPESSLWTNRLAATDNTLLGSAPVSVATSPVVLAVPGDGAAALAMTTKLSWGTLASVAADPDGWSRLDRKGWGRFTVALPDPATNPASGLAIQSALAGVAKKPEGPLTGKMMSTPPVQTGIAQLAGAQPGDLPDTTQGALVMLGGSKSVRGAPFSAVATTEVDLYRRNTGIDGQPPAANALIEVAANGPSPVADFPFVALAGKGVDQTQIRAAQSFREFLSAAEQQVEFSKAGLRADGASQYPVKAPGMRWDSTFGDLKPADSTTTQQVNATWKNIADGGQIVTVMADVSRTMDFDGGQGKSRMEWVKSALSGMADWTVSGSLGLWEYSGGLQGEPYEQLAQTLPVTSQRKALHAAVDQLAEPSGARDLYSSVKACYEAAQQAYVPGKRNRIVVIVGGANEAGISYSQLRADLDAIALSSKPIEISFVTVGPNPDRVQLQELASITHGSVASVTDGTGLNATLAQTLSAVD